MKLILICEQITELILFIQLVKMGTITLYSFYWTMVTISICVKISEQVFFIQLFSMGIPTLYNFFQTNVQISICLKITELLLVIQEMKMGMTTLCNFNWTMLLIPFAIDKGYNHLHIACESGHDSSIKHYQTMVLILICVKIKKLVFFIQLVIMALTAFYAYYWTIIVMSICVKIPEPVSLYSLSRYG